MLAATHPIVHVNASLNLVATMLLVIGLWLIKRGRVEAHKRTMLAAFAVSAAFLVGYVWYHVVMKVGSVRFTHPSAVRYVYFSILISHVILAITVPPLAIRQMYLGFRALGCCPPPGHQAEQLTVAAAFRAEAYPTGPLDVPYLALCIDHRRDRVRNAVSSLAASRGMR